MSRWQSDLGRDTILCYLRDFLGNYCLVEFSSIGSMIVGIAIQHIEFVINHLRNNLFINGVSWRCEFIFAYECGMN